MKLVHAVCQGLRLGQFLHFGMFHRIDNSFKAFDASVSGEVGPTTFPVEKFKGSGHSKTQPRDDSTCVETCQTHTKASGERCVDHFWRLAPDT